MIEAKSDWTWVVLAHVHNVGAQFFLSITLLSSSLMVYVILGLCHKCLDGAECSQNGHADLGEQFLSVLPSPPHGLLMKQIQELWKWSVATCKQITLESLNAYKEPVKMHRKAMGGLFDCVFKTVMSCVVYFTVHVGIWKWTCFWGSTLSRSFTGGTGTDVFSKCFIKMHSWMNI